MDDNIKNYKFKSSNDILDFAQSSPLRLNHFMKKYIQGKLGQWKQLQYKTYTLSQDHEVKIVYDEILEVYTLESSRLVYLSGRPCYGGVVFSGDRMIVDQEIFEFKEKNKTETEIEAENVDGISEEVVNSELPVLLIGETGTGKGTLAKKIHNIKNKFAPWVHLNISALPPSLVESELFGHKRGSFTGAVGDFKGAIKSAHNGVLFLDEIDSLSLELQGKLLLFLDNFEFKPVGSNFADKVKVKMIIASGKQLEELVKEGKMRKDFFYRITGGHVIKLPALRHQPEIIVKFCHDYCSNNRFTIDKTLIDYYKTLPWFGNIRQIKSHLDRKKSYKKGINHFSFDDSDLELKNCESSYMDYKNLVNGKFSNCTLDELQKLYAEIVFRKSMGDKKLASQHLGVSIRALNRLLDETVNLRKYL